MVDARLGVGGRVLQDFSPNLLSSRASACSPGCTSVMGHPSLQFCQKWLMWVLPSQLLEAVTHFPSLAPWPLLAAYTHPWAAAVVLLEIISTLDSIQSYFLNDQNSELTTSCWALSLSHHPYYTKGKGSGEQDRTVFVMPLSLDGHGCAFQKLRKHKTHHLKTLSGHLSLPAGIRSVCSIPCGGSASVRL